MKNILFIYLICIALVSCEKYSGEGGTSKIEGEIIYFTTTYNTQTQINDTHYFPKAGKDVYIIYSDQENEVYDDKFETDWQGRYHFEFLRKGEYTIYTHVDSIVVNDVTYDYPIFQHINISSNNTVYTMPECIIQD